MSEGGNNSNYRLSGATLFTVYDENDDGYITKKEIKNIADTTSIDYGITDEYFDAVDINKDGKVSKGELAFALMGSDTLNKENFKSLYGDKEGEELFKAYDTDKDGKVTRDEALVYEINNADKFELSGWGIAAVITAIIAIFAIAIALISNSEQEQKDNREARHNLQSYNNLPSIV